MSDGQLTINGVSVQLKTRFPARDNWDLPGLLMTFAQTSEDGTGFDLERITVALPRLVESWDFPGDPADPEAYGDLDLFRELIPLVREVSQALGEMMGGSGGFTGEAASAST